MSIVCFYLGFVVPNDYKDNLAIELITSNNNEYIEFKRGRICMYEGEVSPPVFGLENQLEKLEQMQKNGEPENRLYVNCEDFMIVL